MNYFSFFYFCICDKHCHISLEAENQCVTASKLNTFKYLKTKWKRLD